MLIPSANYGESNFWTSLSRRVNANSQQSFGVPFTMIKLIKKGEC